ncbi:MAG: thiamine pyrophosphate-dependent dehydrogenase E1 component subunit alpha [Deltaproteobacteria bacterium]|nr:thiamine pyrophosphate-dependent dehydrogenase E1 component subunit alpha [Deltaproteobacteria bacterium]
MQVIREDGSLDSKRDPGLSVDEIIALYKAMVRTRIVDDRLERIQRQGRIAFHVGSLGEEAAIIGAAAALRDQDWIVPCYREVGALLWRGYPLQRYVDHMYGNADDPVRGRQMPDHTFSRSHRYLAVSAPIGTQIPHAVGLAMAAKTRKLDECVGVFFGDGATSSNDFHAAMNFAGVFQSPVVFLCRNNGYAISLPVERQTATRTIAEKAAAYRVPASRVDGNDALAVFAAVREGMQRAAHGGGPTFIELLTYRLGGHSTSDDPRIYRSEEEVEAWGNADPILRLRRHIEHRGVWNDGLDEDWRTVCDLEVKDCVRRAEHKPPPEIAEVFTDVYAEQPWHLREQGAQALDGPRAAAEEDES